MGSSGLKGKKIAVLLAGSGVYDGSEIHESVLSLLAIKQLGGEYQCFAPNKEQFHVVNHLTGEVENETRNVLVESARIARGEIKELGELVVAEFDALVIPGGFGAAKNLNQWAISGPQGPIDPVVAEKIQAFHAARKPLVGLCMGPTVIAQALAQKGVVCTLSMGSVEAASPYDIAGINAGLQSLGHETHNCLNTEIFEDEKNRIISAPSYMMDTNIALVYEDVVKAIGGIVKSEE